MAFLIHVCAMSDSLALQDTSNQDTSNPIPGRSLQADAMRRLMRNRAAMTSLCLLSLITLACLIGPYFLQWRLDEVDYTAFQAPPNFATAHYFGTEANGRDMLVRTLYGGQISLLVGLVASLVSLVIGVFYGAMAGYIGGRADNVMMRIVDILYSLPFMFVVILLMVFLGRSIVLMFIGIGAVEWLDMARIVRGQTLSLKRKEFIEAAEACGVSSFAIITRHIIPNTLSPVIVYVTLTVPRVILLESFLSFIGFGVQEPMTSWGVLVSEGAANMETSPWMLWFPALFLALTLFCLNFIGDGLRDAFDPKDR